MTIIETEVVPVYQPASKVFDFLCNLNNHQQLMPEQVVNWQSDKDSCSFTIKGTADLSLRIKDTQLWNHIYLEPFGKVPFPFTLKWEIMAEGEGCIVKNRLEADMNMFIKMVAAKPLENFLQYQLTRLKEIMNG